MGIRDFFRALLPRNRTTVTASDQRLLEWLGIDPDQNGKPISEVTYYTCMRVLSEAMGKIPIKFYHDEEDGRHRADPTEMSKLLTIRPNPYMTPTTLWATTEYHRQEYGNAFIYIQSHFTRTGRFGGEIHYDGLWPLHPEDVTVWVDDAGIFGKPNAIHYEYRSPKTAQSYMFDASEVMHFKTWLTDDGIIGKPVRQILRETVGGATASQKLLNEQFSNGLSAAMVMQYTGDLDDERIKRLRKKFAEKLTGPQAAGKVIPIPMGLTLTPLSQKFSDAQFYELKKYTAVQIAGAFGISPTFINNYDHASYSNSEAEQLHFLVNTMSASLKAYEEEINYKCLLPKETDANLFFKFNEGALLRTDKKTQMEIVSSGVQNAIYAPNEARRLLDLPDKEGGDILMANGNYIPITMVGSQYSDAPVDAGEEGGQG